MMSEVAMPEKDTQCPECGALALRLHAPGCTHAESLNLEERVNALEAQVRYLSLELIMRTSKEVCFCGHPREIHKPASYCRAEELLKITCHCGGYVPPEPKRTATVPMQL